MGGVDVNTDAYVILGASGQLGSRTAALLAARQRPMLLVGRRSSALLNTARHCKSAKTFVFDVVKDDRSQLLAATQMEGSRLVIIDAILDKTTTRSMCASTLAATQTVAALRNMTQSRGQTCLAICASSIAAFASWPGGTTYSHAKRHQADLYDKLCAPAIVVHFPVLYIPELAKCPKIDRFLCAYLLFNTHACSIEMASRILECATLLSQPNHCVRMFVKTRRYMMAELRGVSAQCTPNRILSTLAAPVVGLVGKLALRQNPAWQRRAAYALRYVLPKRFLPLDHHVIAEKFDISGPPDKEVDGLRFYLTEPWVCDVRQERLQLLEDQ